MQSREKVLRAVGEYVRQGTEESFLGITELLKSDLKEQELFESLAAASPPLPCRIVPARILTNTKK